MNKVTLYILSHPLTRAGCHVQYMCGYVCTCSYIDEQGYLTHKKTFAPLGTP